MKTYFIIGIRFKDGKVSVSELYPTLLEAYNAAYTLLAPVLNSVEKFTVKELKVVE